MYWLTLYLFTFCSAIVITTILDYWALGIGHWALVICGIIAFWCWWYTNFGDNSPNEIYFKLAVLLAFGTGCITVASYR
jgi:hypothetical protein